MYRRCGLDFHVEGSEKGGVQLVRQRRSLGLKAFKIQGQQRRLCLAEQREALNEQGVLIITGTAYRSCGLHTPAFLLVG